MAELDINAGGGGSVRSWASQIDPKAMEQAKRSARSPAVSGPIALMPDAHWGMGATVGSVIPSQSAIIPSAVGVDIGCGMIAAALDATALDLPDDLNPLLSSISRAIPAGFSWHDEVETAANRWMNANRMPDNTIVRDKVLKRAGSQLGTLGGGNHFVEVCLDESDRVWLVLHSGSRGIGNAVAQHFIRDAKALCADLDRSLEDKDLAYYLAEDDGYQRYIDSMLWAQSYAAQNRELMMDALLAQTAKADIPSRVMQRINCHHNYTCRETHDGVDQWITRKGAIRAGTEDYGVIPGSMGAASYIVRGLGNPQSYCSASHGAGRQKARKQTRREHTADEFAAAMPAHVTWQSDRADALLDEAPFAYKDIEQVMADQSDLVQIEARLTCVLNYKGLS